MAGNKGKTPNKKDVRNLRTQQLLSVVIGILVILSMIISLIVK